MASIPVCAGRSIIIDVPRAAYERAAVNDEVTDADGNLWVRITRCGFQRKVDQFFWPADPRDKDNFLGLLAPSVAQVAAKRGDK